MKMELGADLHGLQALARRFDVASDSLTSVAASIDRASWGLPPRFAANRQQIARIASQIRSHGHRLDESAQRVLKQEASQRRVSGDRVAFSGVVLPSVRLGRSVGPGVTAAGGVIRVLGRQASRVGVLAISSAARVGRAAVSDEGQKAFSIGSDSYQASQTIRRAFVKFPNAPRKVYSTLNQNVSSISKRYAGQGVSPVTRSKNLKAGSFGALSVVGSFSAIVLEKTGKNEAYRKAGEGSGKVLDALFAAKNAQEIFAKTQAGLRSFTSMVRPATELSGRAASVAKVGGALAIVGGTIGLVQTYADWKSGKIDGKRAIGGGVVNGASIVGGVLLFTPAAPLGAAILVGAAVGQAALWAYDNRQKIASFAVASVQKAATSAVGKAVLKGLPARALVADTQRAVQVSKKLTASVAKVIPKMPPLPKLKIGRR